MLQGCLADFPRHDALTLAVDKNNLLTVCCHDWKMGRDDCTYALRKLYSTCTKDKAKESQGGVITYRCVNYKSWAVNMRD
jgi:hypothetical protein